MLKCPVCGHDEHHMNDLGGICIGCVCTYRGPYAVTCVTVPKFLSTYREYYAFMAERHTSIILPMAPESILTDYMDYFWHMEPRIGPTLAADVFKVYLQSLTRGLMDTFDLHMDEAELLLRAAKQVLHTTAGSA